MTLPIIEQPLYGEMLFETSPWATPFVWTDRTADLVSGLNYSQGGRVGAPGSSTVDVGTLNATLKNLASVPAVGALVRISFSKFAGYAFVGYVQDVSQRIVFDNSISLSTPVTLTTLNCVDWVGYIGQFQAVGAGGANSTTGVPETTSFYDFARRVAALNLIIDPTNATKIINPQSDSSGLKMGDTDYVGSFKEHLDLIAMSSQAFWFAQNILPTNTTTGRTGLVQIRQSLVASGKTFTDLAGSAGQLHYTEIDIENSTQNIANSIVVNNRTRIHIADPDVTKIGGFNETNYLIVNNQNVVGVGVDRAQKATDATSITTYGNRQSEFDANVGAEVNVNRYNLISNPSVEYSDDGYSGIANSKVRRRQPLQEASPFAAYNGLWAMRARQSTAAASTRITYSGGESDGIPVTGGATYYISGYAARGTPSRTDMISSMTIEWFNDDEASISTATTANSTLTTANTWYGISGSAVAPATAVRATIRMSFARSGGGNISVGDFLWADALKFTRTTGFGYFDGDTPWTTANGYFWTGGVGSSPTAQITNYIDNLATTLLAQYSSTSLRISRIRWNAQEDLASIPSLSVGKTISLIYKGTTTTHRIIGIDGSVDSERYMIDYYLQKV
jgi:hypothetical protein